MKNREKRGYFRKKAYYAERAISIFAWFVIIVSFTGLIVWMFYPLIPEKYLLIKRLFVSFALGLSVPTAIRYYLTEDKNFKDWGERLWEADKTLRDVEDIREQQDTLLRQIQLHYKDLKRETKKSITN